MATSQADIAVALAEEGFRIIPVQAGGKRPLVGDWADSATSDPIEISQLWQQFRGANAGIPTGSVNDLVVIDIDTEEAKEWWNSLGIPAGLKVSTPSGGIHYYYATSPEDDIQTNRSKLFPGVDVRAEGGQVVAPGSRTYKGEYRAATTFTLANIPEVPEKLLDILPRRQSYSHATQSEVKEIAPASRASEQEESELSWIRRTLDELPRPWREGAGWRATAFQMSCWLWRMVRSPHYVLTADQAASLLLEHAPSDERWGESALLNEWADAEKRTEGQVADAPSDDNPALIDWDEDLLYDRDLPTINGEAFAKIWDSNPPTTTDGALWAHRQKLFIALLRSGEPDEIAATLVWHARATKLPGISFGDHYIIDSDARRISISDLWKELRQAKSEISKDGGEAITSAPTQMVAKFSPRKNDYQALDDDEREAVSKCHWWGRRFMDWAEETFTLANLPYYRMNRWSVLSVIFSPHARLPGRGGNDRPLNLYQAIIGSTTTGKTAALSTAMKILRKFYPDGETPDIGGGATAQGLTKVLIDRDGKSSFMHIDEAHTKLPEWKKPTGPYSEMPGKVTAVFDGEVTGDNTSGDREYAGKHASAFMTLHLMGTSEEMADVMDPADWQSGFLNRFVWTIGDPAVRGADAATSIWVPEDEVDLYQVEDDPATKMYQQWAGEFHMAVRRIEDKNGGYSRMRLPQEVIDRHTKFVLYLEEIINEHPDYEKRLRPTFQRFQESIMRCAALVALSEGSLRIAPIHHLIALEQAEEWLFGMLHMVSSTDESLRTRHVNLVEQEIERNRGSMSMTGINRIRRLRDQQAYVKGLVEELIAQGRARRRSVGEQVFIDLTGVAA
ncbi:MAG: bifunctional DNA primase/polymerase [Microbacterium gubbeenense]|uniref:bifunctional DNA primase/polymerase n=1 Tax=Microbacterium gubbeenense TaxID=159896 RepID=UPI003F981BCC